jgi:hypothetical protein
MCRILTAAASVTRPYFATLFVLALIPIVLLVGGIGALFNVVTTIASLLSRNIVRARLHTHALISRRN